MVIQLHKEKLEIPNELEQLFIPRLNNTNYKLAYKQARSPQLPFPFPKKLKAPTTKASVPVFNVGCTTGAKKGL